MSASKKEAYIQVGKTRHRITTEHHALLSELNDALPYLSMEHLLFQTSLAGARFALSTGIVTLIIERPHRAR
jgi:hypothetical protein